MLKHPSAIDLYLEDACKHFHEDIWPGSRRFIINKIVKLNEKLPFEDYDFVSILGVSRVDNFKFKRLGEGDEGPELKSDWKCKRSSARRHRQYKHRPKPLLEFEITSHNNTVYHEYMVYSPHSEIPKFPIPLRNPLTKESCKMGFKIDCPSGNCDVVNEVMVTFQYALLRNVKEDPLLLEDMEEGRFVKVPGWSIAWNPHQLECIPIL